jgi:cytochrome P450
LERQYVAVGVSFFELWVLKMYPPTNSGFRPPAPTPQARPLGPLALLKALRANPLECWTEAHFNKPIVTGGFPFARVAVVSDPAAVRQVLVEDQQVYCKSAIERRVLAVRMRNGLVTVSGEQWQRQRRVLAPMFGRKMTTGFAPAMARVVDALVERWQSRPEGSVVEVKSEMSHVALEALLRCIFSDGIGDPEAVGTATTRYYRTGGGLDPFDIIGLPDFIPRFTRRGIGSALRSYDDALSEAIAERRRSLAADPNAPRDMLGAMLAAEDPETGERLTETEVKDNVMTFFFAGQETTSSTMTWVLYLLSQSPEWRERVAEEAESVRGSAVEALVQTRAVVEEALRLYPPVIGITRTALRRTELAGRTIERGTMIIISPYVLHRHSLLWGDPNLFDPTRFLPGRAKTIERYAYLPFGVGPRVCIGAAFALQEATLVVATLMKHFVLDLVPGQSVWPVIEFTTKPRDGLRMAVTRRLSRTHAAG